jgi:hypothetical protein
MSDHGRFPLDNLLVVCIDTASACVCEREKKSFTQTPPEGYADYGYVQVFQWLFIVIHYILRSLEPFQGL